jgi:hypothetical protein
VQYKKLNVAVAVAAVALFFFSFFFYLEKHIYLFLLLINLTCNIKNFEAYGQLVLQLYYVGAGWVHNNLKKSVSTHGG